MACNAALRILKITLDSSPQRKPDQLLFLLHLRLRRILDAKWLGRWQGLAAALIAQRTEVVETAGVYPQAVKWG